VKSAGLATGGAQPAAGGIKALVLDLDGLLIDSEVWSWQAHDDVLVSMGCEPLTTDEIGQMVGLSGLDEWDMLRTLRSLPDERARYSAAHTESYLRLSEAGLAAMPGSADLLLTASQLGLTVALASNSPLSSARATLQALGFLDDFDALATSDQVARGKPEADVHLLALKLLDVEPVQALAIEDSVVGLRAASAAGLRCLVVPNSVTTGLDFTGAWAICADLHEAAALLSRLKGHDQPSPQPIGG
jgi:putative hydrolase of the HAD superfamily